MSSERVKMCLTAESHFHGIVRIRQGKEKISSCSVKIARKPMHSVRKNLPDFEYSIPAACSQARIGTVRSSCIAKLDPVL